MTCCGDLEWEQLLQDKLMSNNHLHLLATTSMNIKDRWRGLAFTLIQTLLPWDMTEGGKVLFRRSNLVNNFPCLSRSLDGRRNTLYSILL